MTLLDVSALDSEKCCALFSIKPEYAERILTGEKKFEFRTVLLKRSVSSVYIYATAPICAVVGKFELQQIAVGSAKEVWTYTCQFAGIEEDAFFSYYSGKKKAVAYCVTNPVRFATPYPLSVFSLSRPPQSFAYVESMQLSKRDCP